MSLVYVGVNLIISCQNLLAPSKFVNLSPPSLAHLAKLCRPNLDCWEQFWKIQFLFWLDLVIAQYIPFHISKWNIQFPIFDKNHKIKFLFLDSRGSRKMVKFGGICLLNFMRYTEVKILMNAKVLNYFFGSLGQFCQVRDFSYLSLSLSESIW